MIGNKTILGWLRVLCLLAAVASAGACAQVPKEPAARAEYDKRNDPLEPLNRWVFKINIALDKAIFRPVARAWKAVLPQITRDNVKNVIDNYSSPVTFINDILQGEPGRAAETFVRFWFNTVVGVGGLFDPAGELGLKRHEEDFGQTLAVWGVGEGPYLMVLFIGPNSVRHLFGRAVDSQSNPFGWLIGNLGYVAQGALAGSSVIYLVDERSRDLGLLEDLEKNSLDFYAAVRSLYRQNRKSEILNGKVKDLPVPGDDDDDDDDDDKK